MTPKELFEFANSEIAGVTTHLVNFQSVKENIPFLESRFSNYIIVKGTHKNHAFIPGGENINNLIIHQKEVVLSIEDIMPGSLYACFCDDE